MPKKKKSKKEKREQQLLKLKIAKLKAERYLGKAWDFLQEHGGKIPELAAYGGCAWLGADTFGDAKGALFGLIALKLATTPGGEGAMSIYSPFFGIDIPFNSQTVGLGMLAALGITRIMLPAIKSQAAQVAGYSVLPPGQLLFHNLLKGIRG